VSNLIFPSTLPGCVLTGREALDDDALIEESLSKRELRSTWSTYGRYRYEFTFSVLRSATAFVEYQKVLGFRSRHRGTLDSFLLTDAEDNTVTAHPFGIGDGVTTSFQLQRTLVASTDLAAAASRAYWPTMGDGYEPIWDVNSAPAIYKDTGGGPVLQVLSVDYTLPGLGTVTFTAAPAANAILTWTGTYYRRVRFESASLPTGRIVSGLWSAKCTLISIKSQEATPPMVPPQFGLTPKSETPTGTINGTTGSDGNATFTLSHTPVGPVAIYRNSIRLTQGVDYTVASATITAIAPNIPIAGDSYVADYFYTV